MEWILGFGFGLVVYAIAAGAKDICQRLDAIHKQLDRIERSAVQRQNSLQTVESAALKFLD